MAEREQAGVAEEQVVGEREPGERQHQREELQRAGTVEARLEEDRDVDRELRREREQGNERHGDRESLHVAAAGVKPCGRTRSTTASRSTTERSPMPLDA